MKYFKELDDNYLDKPFSIECYGTITSTKLPYEFYIKHKSVFTRINDLDKIFEFITIREALKEQHEIKRDDDENDEMIVLDNKIWEMVKRLASTYGDASYNLEQSLEELLFDKRQDNFLKIRKLIKDYDDISDILYYYRDLLKLLRLTNDNLLQDINNAIEDIKKYRATIGKCEYRTRPLPDSWYILPETGGMDACLYNTTSNQGHQEVTLDNIFRDIFIKRKIFTQEDADGYYQSAKEKNDSEFIKRNDYMTKVKMVFADKDPHILDSTGIIYGTRENFLRIQKNFIEYHLEFLEELVPEEKKDEIHEFVREKSKYFNILDSNGLPTGLHEIIDKIFEYSDISTNSGLTIDRRTNGECFYRLNIVLNEINDLIFKTKIYLESNTRSRFIYNQDAKKLVIGNEMAHGLIVQFFSNLYRYAKDYNACLWYLRRCYSRDELLVRACGFNKVVRQRNGNDCYKEIITSNPNYEEEFKEYKEHGWKITFISPLKIDYYNKTLRNMDSYYKVKKFHRKEC